MKKGPAANRPSPILILAPVAFLLLGYNYFFNLPQQQALSARRAALGKLQEKASEVRHEYGHVLSDLAAARQQETQLREQLVAAKTTEKEVLDARSRQLNELIHPAKPAATLGSTIALLERHRLICLDNRATNSDKGSSMHEVLKPVADLLGGSPQKASSRVEYRIKLSGRYADLRRALHELLETRPDILPLSIEMDAPRDLRTDQRTWILTLLV